MADIFSPKKRSEIMSKIRSANTKPEITIRKWLHAQGFRFRLHKSSLPGIPDIVLKKHNTIIFVNGCFWHRHRGCKRAYVPKSNVQDWEQKFSKTIIRDKAKQIKKSL